MSTPFEGEVGLASIEYTAEFRKPSAEPILLRNAYPVLDMLQPFGFGVDGVEVRMASAKWAEHAIVFQRNPVGVQVALFVNKLVCSLSNPDWSQADLFTRILSAALNAVTGPLRAEVDRQRLILHMHVQIKNGDRADVVSPLFDTKIGHLLGEPTKFQGAVLYSENLGLVVDASVALANAIYFRLDRVHPAGHSAEEIADALRADQARILEGIGVNCGL